MTLKMSVLNSRDPMEAAVVGFEFNIFEDEAGFCYRDINSRQFVCLD